MSDEIPGSRLPLRVLVAIASYGSSNDRHLRRLIEEYRSMAFALTIVVLSDRHKELGSDVELRVGLPNSNPWSLPFAHKQIFAERLQDFDLFIYSEDDILITEKNLRSFLTVSENVQEDELPGFIRFEIDADGQISYPDAHFHFHWMLSSVVTRGPYTLARFTNDHAACYALTQAQLQKALKSGGLMVKPHEWKYDLLCSAATDPYTQCGFTKLIPVSHFDAFSVHHLSNKYAGKVGIGGTEMRRQVDGLLRIARNPTKAVPLVEAETKLWHGIYSKDYYEPLSQEVVSMIPPNTRSVLSIGCGSGATERRLVEKGLHVIAMPLDSVICADPAMAGIEMIEGDFRNLRNSIQGKRPDCALFLNILHLFPDPVAVLAACRDILAIDSSVIIQAPNMRCASNLVRRARHASRYRGLGSYEATGVHITTPKQIRRWCRNAGLKPELTAGFSRQKRDLFYDFLSGTSRNAMPDFVNLFLAPDFVTVAQKA